MRVVCACVFGAKRLVFVHPAMPDFHSLCKHAVFHFYSSSSGQAGKKPHDLRQWDYDMLSKQLGAAADIGTVWWQEYARRTTPSTLEHAFLIMIDVHLIIPILWNPTWITNHCFQIMINSQHPELFKHVLTQHCGLIWWQHFGSDGMDYRRSLLFLSVLLRFFLITALCCPIMLNNYSSEIDRHIPLTGRALFSRSHLYKITSKERKKSDNVAT